MNDSLRIAVADDEPDMRDYFATILPGMGHEVVAVARTGRELIDLCRESRPDLLIVDIRMPEMDGIEAAAEICCTEPVPVILVSAFHDPDTIERAGAEYVFAYLVKPIKQADLKPAIAIAMKRFQQFQELRREAVDLRQALDDRKIIDRAKGVLMKRGGMEEQDAFRRLQKLANQKNLKLVEVARHILLAEEAIGPP
ncbi:MAG: response regulator [Rhodopirellula sp.]|nr:response regulator [Rhodopirellula sp.]